MAERTFASVLTQRGLTMPADGAATISLISNVAPELAPRRYGNFEPLRERFDPANVDAIMARSWIWPFLWKGATSLEGSVFMSNDADIHGAVSLSAAVGDVDAGTLLQVVERLSVEFLGDLGFVHRLNAADIERGYESETVQALDRSGSEWSLTVTSQDLARSIPDVYWATIFGPSYCTLLGRERLATAPAAVVREIAPSTWLLQLTETPDHPDAFEPIRDSVKAHLGPEFFFDPSAPDRACVVPEFQFARD